MKQNIGSTRVVPYIPKLLNNDTSDSQEPTHFSAGEMSPCTPTENVHHFKTPTVCPPTPVKTPSTHKKTMKKKAGPHHFGTPMISSRLTNDENHVQQLLRTNKIKRIAVVAPSPAPKRMCNSAQRPLAASTPNITNMSSLHVMSVPHHNHHGHQHQYTHYQHSQSDQHNLESAVGGFRMLDLAAPKVQQTMNPAATPFRLVTPPPADAHRHRMGNSQANSVFRSLQFDEDDDNDDNNNDDDDEDDDIVEEEDEQSTDDILHGSNRNALFSPKSKKKKSPMDYQFSSIPRSTYKSNPQHHHHQRRSSMDRDQIKSIALFSSDDSKMQDEEESAMMMEDEETGSPILMDNNNNNNNNNGGGGLLGFAGSPLLSTGRHKRHSSSSSSSSVVNTSNENSFNMPSSPDLFNHDCASYASEDDLLANEDEEPEPYLFEAASQSQMTGCTPPRSSQNPNYSSPTNITLLPCRLTTETVHENVFSPERNINRKVRRSLCLDVCDQPPKTSKREKSPTPTMEAPAASQAEGSYILAYFSRYKEDFDEVAVLGNGSFGKVTKVKHRLDGICYAVKQTKRRIKGEKDKKALLKEVQALATLVDNQHVVRYFSAWLEDERLYVQTELCEGGTWAKQIEEQTLFTEEQLIRILRQMATGLQQMHTQNIVHLDIKPENIYLSNVGLYKIGDLGLAASSLQEQYDVNEGDSRYLARELLNGQSEECQLTKVDIFSLGASLYEAAIRRALPMNGDEWHEIRNGNLKYFDSPDVNYSEEFKALVRSMLHPDPNQRPSAYDILQHKLVLRAKMSYEELEKKYFALEELLKKQKETEEALRRSLAQLSATQ